MASLLADREDELDDIIRGRASFGSLLEARGIPCTPSYSNRVPSGDIYYSGAYTSFRYGAPERLAIMSDDRL